MASIICQALAAGNFDSSPATFGGVTLTTAGSALSSDENVNAVLWKVNGDGTTVWAVRGGGSSVDYLNGVVGRCRLTVPKPVLKARMVSALEPRIS